MSDPTTDHPVERERLETAATLVVTVASDREFHDDVTGGIERLADGDTTDTPPRLTVADYDELAATLTPQTLELIETVRREAPENVTQTARLVDRDVKNVHEELTRLAALGIVDFESVGRRRRPTVWFDELRISLPVAPDGERGDSHRAAP